MQADDFIKLVDNPNFISGIYNYCNRWCEKCNFTDRCTVGTMEQLIHFGRDPGEPLSLDEFTDMMEMATGETIDKKDVKTIHIDLDDLSQQEDEMSLLNELTQSEEDMEFERGIKAAQEFVEAHPIIQVAHEYTIDCFKLKNRIHKYFHIAENEYPVNIKYIGIYPIPSEEKGEQLASAFEIIDWYAMMIEIKLKRALHGYFTDKEDFAHDDHQTDFNGSAKIAVLGIIACLNAFQELQDFFVEEDYAIHKLKLLLGAIHQKTYEQFPNLDKFIRPGFDVS